MDKRMRGIYEWSFAYINWGVCVECLVHLPMKGCGSGGTKLCCLNVCKPPLKVSVESSHGQCIIHVPLVG